MKTMKKPKPPEDAPAPRTTAEEILAAIAMAKEKEASVEVIGLDMALVKKFLHNLAYTFIESKDGKRVVVNFPQRDERGKPFPPGTKPKYQISIH
jgi:hypothetical protein